MYSSINRASHWGADDEGVVQEKCITNVCQPGNNLLAAGYCMYSSSCILMLTVGHGVYGFTLDPSIGEFVLSHEDVKIPEKGKIYSFNEGNYVNWEPGLKEYMDALKKGGHTEDGKPYSARYIGSLVGDFHRTMLYGGIYGYPATRNQTQLPCTSGPMASSPSRLAGWAAPGGGGCWTFDRGGAPARAVLREAGGGAVSRVFRRRRVAFVEVDGRDPKGEECEGTKSDKSFQSRPPSAPIDRLGP